MQDRHSTDPVLLDVSRLIWRLWTGRLPTGIDRVCLEYVRHFGPSALAVVQVRGRVVVLGKRASRRLFQLLIDGGSGFRTAMARLALRAIPFARRSPPRPGMVYLNVGHTGLDQPALPKWIEANRVRAVYLIHDLIPITHPQFCRDGEDQKHAGRMRNALASAAGIIANSKATLDELERFASAQDLPMPPATIAWISGYSTARKGQPPKLGRPYFVVLGTIEARKNHLLLLRVWTRLVAKLGDSAPLLVIVGQRGWKAEEATAILDDPGEIAGFVRELGRCEDEELADLLAGARALLMPSFTEGFGLPIIEALEAGTPVIAADLPVYREVVGTIPTYLDPADEAAWEAGVEAFTGEGAERERQASEMATFRPPDWPTHFAQVEAWLEKVPGSDPS